MKLFKKEYYYDESDGARKERKKREGLISGLIISILSLSILILAFVLVFHIQEIRVTGNQYCSSTEVINWILKDKYATNTIYTWAKYNYLDVEQLPLVEESEVKIIDPWTIEVRVYEKSIIGYLENTGQYIYFDKDGTVIQMSDEHKMDGVPKIEGLEVVLASVKLHKQLPVADKDVFNTILEVTREVENCELQPDRLLFQDGTVTLGFGNVNVLLGQGNMHEKIAQIGPILEKLNERYPETGPCGTLHLENYDNNTQSISFIPEEIDYSDNSEGDNNGDGYVSPYGND